MSMAMARPASSASWSLIDIGINLTDPMFRGMYHGKRRHPDDLHAVLDRCVAVGVSGLLVTGGSLSESRSAIRLCAEKPGSAAPLQLLCTVGCHPTRCDEFVKNPEAYTKSLNELLVQHSIHSVGGCVAAIGEVGLDYDRLHFCGKDTQKTYFAQQLQLAKTHQLPLFLHDRNTGGDFYEMMLAHRDCLDHGGVVHSFTGTKDELQLYLDLGLFIGINGCSLKTVENLDVVRIIPLDRVMIETDGPWCGLRPTHDSAALLTADASGLGGRSSAALLAPWEVSKPEKFKEGTMVKGRCEPSHLVQVLEVLYALRRDEVGSMDELADLLLCNTRKLFPTFTARDSV